LKAVTKAVKSPLKARELAPHGIAYEARDWSEVHDLIEKAVVEGIERSRKTKRRSYLLQEVSALLQAADDWTYRSSASPRDGRMSYTQNNIFSLNFHFRRAGILLAKGEGAYKGMQNETANLKEWQARVRAHAAHEEARAALPKKLQESEVAVAWAVEEKRLRKQLRAQRLWHMATNIKEAKATGNAERVKQIQAHRASIEQKIEEEVVAEKKRHFERHRLLKKAWRR